MPRYIDADKLIDLATHEGAYGYVDVHDIRNTPTADVVERKKGIWIKRGVSLYRCSECGRFSPSQENYCPSCGSYNGEENAK